MADFFGSLLQELVLCLVALTFRCTCMDTVAVAFWGLLSAWTTGAELAIPLPATETAVRGLLGVAPTLTSLMGSRHNSNV